MSVSAPGKLLLAGEYAVLNGATAVVAAVDRRAVATRGAREPSMFLDAAARLADDEIAAALREIAVDTSALRDGDVKLGLGSSAAATVAAIGAAFVIAERGLDREAIHALAAAAHREAQGGRGSGADVAASTFGGTIAFAGGVARTIVLPEVTWLPVWLGRPADTVSLVAAVTASGADLGACGAAGAALAEARTPDDVIRAIGAGADAIAALGDAAGVDLFPAEARAARAIARRVGGELKTCGAGGGDVAIAVLPPGTLPLDLGLAPLDLRFDPRGVEIG